MTFDELLEEVYLLTNRRDLVDRTKSAVKAATLKAHRVDFFSKDIYETGISFNSSEYNQTLDYINLIPNFRAFKYVRLASSPVTGDATGPFFDILTPEELLNEYGENKVNVAYVAGRALEIKSGTAFQYALLGCYVNPIVVEAEYSSWVAILFPYAIVYEAANVIFKSAGQMEESRGMRELAGDEFNILRTSALADVGS